MNARAAVPCSTLLVLLGAACQGEADPPADSLRDAAVMVEGASASPVPERVICDGSPDVRFGIYITGGGPHREPDMMTSLGYSYLFVRGDCRYWANPFVFHGWKETRSGKLTEAQEAALSRAFGYPRWGARAGEYLGSALHSATMYAFDGEHSIQCNNSCLFYAPEHAPPAPVDRFSDAYKEWIDALWQSGAASEPSLRVIAELHTYPEPLTDPLDLEILIDWPLAWSLDELIAPTDGPGLLLADESRVRELRELRTRYAGGEVVPGSNNSFLRTDSFVFGLPADRRLQYTLWFRDVLPFEDDTGKIPFLR